MLADFTLFSKFPADFSFFPSISFFFQMRCSTPEIVAGQLTAIRNIYLRQELKTISKLIQTKHREHLPAIDLVTLAAYEQVFNAQV